MKLSISKTIKWSVLLFVAFMALMSLFRLFLFFYFLPKGETFFTNFDAFWLGIRYDARIAAISIAPIFILSSIHIQKKPSKFIISLLGFVGIAVTLYVFLAHINWEKKESILSHIKNASIVLIGFVFFYGLIFWIKNFNPFKSNKAKRGWFIYLIIVIILILYTYSIDFSYYSYLNQRLNSSLLNYMVDYSISMNMMWESYPVIRILIGMILLTWAIHWVLRKLFNIVDKKIESGVVTKTMKISPLIALFLFLCLCVFGRIGQYPLRWSDAFSLGSDFKANIALNPFQSFFSSLSFRNSGYDLKKVRESYPIIAQQYNIENADTTELNFKRIIKSNDSSASKPNIVLVICESFSGYKSSMWGNPLNTTPYFNSLCNNGVFFDHCFTPHYGTARGVWATLTGIPDVEINGTSSRNPSAVDQHTIINDLKDYEKFYFIGGSTSWANIRGLLDNNIKDLQLFEQDNFNASKIDVWGISDKNLFLESNKILSQKNKPFFAIIQTADNHRPYTIPQEDLILFKKLSGIPKDSLRQHGFESIEELNAFRYTDFCIQQFIEAASKEKYFENTIFVFVGDHGIRGNAYDMFPKAWTDQALTTVHVPLLFYAPKLLKPNRTSEIASQIDIMPSIAGLIGATYTNTTLGRNLFDKKISNPAAFVMDHDERQIGVVQGDFYFQKQLNSKKEVFQSIKSNEAVVMNPFYDSIKNSMRKLTMAYYETSKYLIYHNKKNE